MSEIHRIQIHGQDLRFGVGVFDLNRCDQLAEFSCIGLFKPDTLVQRAGQLLGQGRCTTVDLSGKVFRKML